MVVIIGLIARAMGHGIFLKAQINTHVLILGRAPIPQKQPLDTIRLVEINIGKWRILSQRLQLRPLPLLVQFQQAQVLLQGEVLQL